MRDLMVLVAVGLAIMATCLGLAQQLYQPRRPQADLQLCAPLCTRDTWMPGMTHAPRGR